MNHVNDHTKLNRDVEIPFLNHTTLRRLHIHCHGLYDFFVASTHLSSLVPASLELLRVTSEEKDPYNVENKVSWSEVDTILNDTKFSRLRYFELGMGSLVTSGTKSVDFFSTMLPRSYLRGLLWIRPSGFSGPCESLGT